MHKPRAIRPPKVKRQSTRSRSLARTLARLRPEMNELPPELRRPPTELRSVRHQSRRKRLRLQAAGEFELTLQSDGSRLRRIGLRDPAPVYDADFASLEPARSSSG